MGKVILRIEKIVIPGEEEDDENWIFQIDGLESDNRIYFKGVDHREKSHGKNEAAAYWMGWRERRFQSFSSSKF